LNSTVDAGIYVPAKGIIGDYVWFDTDKDGIQDANEIGVGGVIVNLLDASGNVIATTVTDPSGRYLFTDVPAGTYTVEFTNLPTGFVFTTQTNGTDNGSDANTTTGRTNSFTLAAGENKTDIDAGIKPNIAALGNYVWLDLNKDGIQDAGEPGLAGINVTLYNATTNQILAATVTDAYGKYLFDNLTAGSYYVAFTAPTNYIFTAQDATADDKDSDVALTGVTATINLVAGETNLDVDAGLILKETANTISAIGDKVWNDTNANGIQDATEDGVAGVVVTLYSGTNPIATTITDGNGNYQFSNLTAGTYQVGFTLPAGYVFTTQNASGSTPANNSDVTTTGVDFGKTAPITLAAGQVNSDIDAGIKLASPSTSSVGSYVWNDVNNNGIRETGEAGIAGVTVTLKEVGADGIPGSSDDIIVGTTTTNEFGQYIFTNVPSGDYYVQYTKPTGYTFVTPNTTSDDKDSDVTNPTTGTTDVFTVQTGIDKLDVDAGLYNSTLPMNNISGLLWKDADKDGVQDTNEGAIPGATVTLYNSTGTPVATTVTDINGNYSFNNVPNGTYTVGFSNTPSTYVFSSANQGGDDTVDSDVILAGQTGSITLTGSTNVANVDGGMYEGSTASYTASLGDRVWNDMNNNGVQEANELGVANVTVNLLSSTGTLLKTDITDSEGNYSFTGLGAGLYIVEFVSSSFPTGYNLVTANAGTSDLLDSDASITNGRTAIITLAAGEDNMSVDAGIYKNDPTRGNIGNMVWNDLDGDGTQDAGEPGVRGVTVTLYDNSGNVVTVTTTDANGNYLFTNIPAGTYTVGFSNLPEGFTFTSANLGANEALDSDANTTTGRTGNITVVGGTTNNDVDAGVRSTTRGSLGDFVWNDTDKDGVQDANETGVAGVTVILYDATNNPIAATITDAYGKYLFANLLPGSYTLSFTSLPSGAVFTTQDAVAASDMTDSDVNPATGSVTNVSVTAGQFNNTVDAGIYSPSRGII
jgi:protocatechuate 3,4-dioxygenase beta subunit